MSDGTGGQTSSVAITTTYAYGRGFDLSIHVSKRRLFFKVIGSIYYLMAAIGYAAAATVSDPKAVWCVCSVLSTFGWVSSLQRAIEAKRELKQLLEEMEEDKADSIKRRLRGETDE